MTSSAPVGDELGVEATAALPTSLRLVAVRPDVNEAHQFASQPSFVGRQQWGGDTQPVGVPEVVSKPEDRRARGHSLFRTVRVTVSWLWWTPGHQRDRLEAAVTNGARGGARPGRRLTPLKPAEAIYLAVLAVVAVVLLVLSHEHVVEASTTGPVFTVAALVGYFVLQRRR